MFRIVDEITCQLSSRLNNNLFPENTSAPCLNFAREHGEDWASRRGNPGNIVIYTPSVLLQLGLYDLADELYVPASTENNSPAVGLQIVAKFRQNATKQHAISYEDAKKILKFCSDIRSQGLRSSDGGGETFHVDVFFHGDSLTQFMGNIINQYDTQRLHMIIAPCTFLILLCVLSSWRMLIIPLCCLIIARLVSGALHLIVAVVLFYTTFGDLMITSLTFCMSVDWSLFFLCRWKEELRREELGERASNQLFLDVIRPDHEDLTPLLWRCCARTFSSASVTIGGSGSMMAFCFLAMSFFDVSMATSMSLCGFITMVRSQGIPH